MDEKTISWPGWEVVRRVGSGSFGAVYEIERDVFGRKEKAALKVLSIPENQDEINELYNDGNSQASITAHFKEHLEDIVREYSLMLDMKGHPNVVYCDDLRYVQHSDGIGWDIFIKMELLTPMQNVVGKAYDEDQVVRVGMDLCNALVFCKQQNIIHRDIKPQNILVSTTGDYKLGDFGVAKISERTTNGTKTGTPEYMAPEVYFGQPYGCGADIYSLGIVLYWMMNEKRTPFLPLPPQIPSSFMKEEARSRRFHGETIPAPAHGSEELKRIVFKACAFDPKDRYPSAAAMLEDLKKLNKGSVVAPIMNAGGFTEDASTEKLENEGTINIFGKTTAPAPKEEPTVYLPRDEKTEYIAPAPVQPAPAPKKKKKLLPWILGGVAVIILIMALLLKSCGDDTIEPNDDPTSTTGQTEMIDPSTEDTKPSTEPSTEATEPFTEVTEPSVDVTEPSIDTTDPSIGTQLVPNVTGSDEAFAKSALEAWGFNVKKNYVFSDTVRKGVVMNQSVSAGTKAEVGTTITLTISKGPREDLTLAPPTEDPEGIYTLMIDGARQLYDGEDVSIRVGETISLTLIDETSAVMNVEWTMSKTGIVAYGNNQVTGLAIGAVKLTTTYEGQIFTCFVRVTEPNHSDPVVGTQMVPNVTGFDEFFAVSALENWGFNVKRIYVYSNTVGMGVVMYQDIAAGTSAEVGTTVTLTVSRGPGEELTLAPTVAD